MKVVFLWGRGQIFGQDHNFWIKAEDEDQDMLRVMSSGGKPHTQERETDTHLPDIVACSKNALTCKIDGPDYEVTNRLLAEILGGEQEIDWFV